MKTTDEDSATAVYVGPKLYHLNYSEDVPEPRKSTETGMVVGATAGVHAKKLFGLSGLFQANAEVSVANLVYEGTNQTGSVLVSGEGRHTFLNFELLGGPQLHRFSSSSSLLGYTGLGRRYWARGSTGQSGDYEENYRWWYLPIGVRWSNAISRHFTVDVDASFHFNLGGSIDVHISQASQSLADFTSTLGTAIGFRLELPMAYRVSKGFGIHFSPWFEYAAIGRGEWVPLKTNTGEQVVDGGSPLGMYEPASRTLIYGAFICPALYF
ncbi:MAG: hypothetical protein HY537_07080 [Deltaproteobacteria bacterium]|nr:hypothetical protein [Deltaproteobacteria bacterium]